MVAETKKIIKFLYYNFCKISKFIFLQKLIQIFQKIIKQFNKNVTILGFAPLSLHFCENFQIYIKTADYNILHLNVNNGAAIMTNIEDVKWFFKMHFKVDVCVLVLFGAMILLIGLTT